jgi:anaerobic selenocysteine-containing dehydrogenase
VSAPREGAARETAVTAETAASELRRTTCNRDCPDACSLLLTVEDGRPTLLRGDPADPVTQGFLCERTSRFLDRQAAPARFTAPMLRRGGLGTPLLPIGWDEALDLAAERLSAIRDASGPAAILHYRSGGSLGLLKHVADRLFEQFGPVTIKRGDICSGPSDTAQETDFGITESSDLFDVLHSRTILLWGKNVHATSVHLLPVLRKAQAAGALLVGIDPVRTRAAGMCALFLQPRPGADAALAMGIARWLFDHGAVDGRAPERCEHFDAYRALVHSRTPEAWAAEADVPAAELARAAELYGTRKPSAILLGWGLGRRRNGSATTRAIDALAAISGQLGVRGGGVSANFRRRAAFDVSFVQGIAAAPRTFAESCLGPQILAATDPPVRAIWVTAGNPVAMLPESGTVQRAFSRSEFNVVVDTHPTDTTDVAHLVLPTLTLLEDSDVLGAYGNHWIRVSEPALPAPGARAPLDPDSPGPRHELHILQGLARRLGLQRELAGSIDDWKRRLLARLSGAGVGLEQLQAGPTRNPFAAEIVFEGGKVETESGRTRLLAEAPLPAPRTSAEWPLTLLASSTAKAQSSQWSVAVPPGPPDVRVHPGSAAGIADGARAVLESRIASLEVVVRHDPTLRRDVAWMDKGGMLRDGRCANLLVAAVESDAGGGEAYYDQLVRLNGRG